MRVSVKKKQTKNTKKRITGGEMQPEQTGRAVKASAVSGQSKAQL